MQKEKYLTTVDEIRTFSDPYRLNILRTYYSIGKPATVKQIADEMGEVPAKVHYHVKKLLKAGILELDHTEEIKGIIAKFYLPTAKAFYLRKQDELNDEIYLNETAIACTRILDENKRIFLNSINKNKGSLSSEYVYLTEDEYKEVINAINHIFTKHKKHQDKDIKKKYYLFTGIIGMEGKTRELQEKSEKKSPNN